MLLLLHCFGYVSACSLFYLLLGNLFVCVCIRAVTSDSFRNYPCISNDMPLLSPSIGRKDSTEKKEEVLPSAYQS